jgi:raffinose/stachyose/melibiose transport system substrate-binding protein
MKKMNRAVTALAAVTALGLVLAGCSDPTTTPGQASAVTWNEPTAKLDGTQLTFWAAQSTATEAESVVAAFKKTTGATVKIVVVPDPYEANVATKLATGDKPDVMFWQATESVLTQIQGQKNLQVLDGAPWLKNLEPQYQEMGTVNGKHYAAVVKAPDAIGVYYNKQNFEKAGITTMPTNYAEYLAAAQKLKDAGVASPIYEAGGDKWPTQWAVQAQLSDAVANGFYDKLNKNKASFTDPEIVKVISQYQSIFTSGLGNKNVATATFADQADALMSGEAGMEYHISALIDQILASHNVKEVNKTVGYFPLGQSSAVGSSIYGQANTVVAFKTGDTAKEAAARQFLTFWTGTNYQDFITSHKYVSTQSGVETPADIPQALIDSATVAKTVGTMQTLAIVNPDLYLNLSDMLYGQKTPEQVAQATQSQFVQIAKAQGTAGF